MKFKIIYTSDVHGSLLASDYASKKSVNKGISRLKTYLKSQKKPYLLMDNGDILQGSPLLDYHRQFKNKQENPAAIALNNLGYKIINLGNHDFNYGREYLAKYLNEINAEVLCANVVDLRNEIKLKSSIILKVEKDLRIGVVAAVTQYIPNFERKENIVDFKFLDAYETIKEEVKKIRNKVDILVVLYHGGFEKEIITGEPIGRPTKENEGYKISKIKGIDFLLTGHQHVPQVHNLKNGPKIIQTSANAFDFGEIEFSVAKDKNNNWKLENALAKLVNLDFKEDIEFRSFLGKQEKQTQKWLDVPISKTTQDLTITDPLSCRIKKHPLFQFTNLIQTELTKADISVASLPNFATGFKSKITTRDVQANYVYPNTVLKLEVSGKILKQAIEKTSEYFTLEKNVIKISNKFLYPKIEHYNYDVYDGIDYVIDITKPVGKRLVSLKYKGKEIHEKDKFTLAINNYRAVGGGDYEMFKKAKVLKEYDVSLADLATNYLKKHPKFQIKLINNFSIKK
jgi:2',3'-cyclic-nucleotide 2'-phosphodiesterase / 3'-nucleotidase